MNQRIAEIGWHGLAPQGRGGGPGASLPVNEERVGRVPRPDEYKTSLTSSGTQSGGTPDDDAALEAHLKTCPACAAEYEEQLRLRGLLSSLRDERPSEQEIKTMWNVIQQGRSAAVAVARKPGLFASLKPFLVPAAAVAAVLAVAFGLGTVRYGSPARELSRRHLSQMLPSMSNIKGDATSGRVYEADDATGWGIPVHPKQYAEAGSSRTSAPVPSPSASAPERKGKTMKRPPSGSAPGGGIIPFANVPLEDAADIMNSLKGSADVARGEGASAGRSSAPVPAPPAPEVPTPAVAGTDLDYQAGRNLANELLPATHPDVNVADHDARHFVKVFEDEQAATSPKELPQTTAPEKQSSLKLIKTGELAVEVPDYAQAVRQIDAIVAKHGGFIADALSKEETGGALTGRIVIRVAPEQFEVVFAALKSVGRVESENAKAADVTAEYVDLEARIKSLQITEERLHDLVKNKSVIDKVSALLEVERELGRVRSQIEQFQGQLRVMADRIGLSTITMTVREPARTVPAASLSVEVATLDEAAKSLGEVLTTVGGELRSGKTSKRSDGTLMGNYEVRVSLAKFAELLSSIESLGRVEERQIKDRQFSDATAPWAGEVKCTLALVFFEQSRQLPSGMLGLEIDALDPAMKRLDEILSTAGGALTSNRTTRQGDGSNVAELKIRIPAGKFASLVDALPALGRMTSRNVFGEAGRIAGGAAAVPCELSLSLTEKPREIPSGRMQVEVERFEPARKELSTIITETNVQVLHSSSNQRTDGTWAGTFRLGIKAAEMEKVVSRIEKLGRVNAREISGLGLGDLSRVDPSSLGTIDLMLAEKTAISPGSEQTFGSIRMYMRDGLRGLYTSLGLILFGLTLMAPWLVIVGLCTWLVVKVRARRRGRTAVVAAATQPAET